jgi:hypothetical protein
MVVPTLHGLCALTPTRGSRGSLILEAAIGWIKARTRYQAARRATTREWSCDDLEPARILSNEAPTAHDTGTRGTRTGVVRTRYCFRPPPDAAGGHGVEDAPAEVHHASDWSRVRRSVTPGKRVKHLKGGSVKICDDSRMSPEYYACHRSHGRLWIQNHYEDLVMKKHLAIAYAGLSGTSDFALVEVQVGTDSATVERIPAEREAEISQNV